LAEREPAERVGRARRGRRARPRALWRLALRRPERLVTPAMMLLAAAVGVNLLLTERPVPAPPARGESPAAAPASGGTVSLTASPRLALPARG
jgi:hypothetical protein